MTARVYIHVGPYKTGTTFLQQVLDANRAALAERGLCVPAGSILGQSKAAHDVLGLPMQGDRAKVRGCWRALTEEVHAWPGPVAVISDEVLCRAGARQVDRMVSSLAPADVHVVFTARDLARVIPAMWQTHMRNKASEPWESYLARVREPSALAPYGKQFWREQDPRLVLGPWESRVPLERIHVVTVPPSGAEPGLLWERFCSVVGADPSACSLQVRRANESLGTAEAELLRRINARVAAEVRPVTYVRWVKNFVAREVLEPRPDQRKFALPEEEHTWLRPRAEEICRFLDGRGYDVVGDLADLLPRPVPAAVTPDTVEAEEMLDASVDVIAGLLGKIDGSARRSGPPTSHEGVVGETRRAVLTRWRRARQFLGPRLRRGGGSRLAPGVAVAVRRRRRADQRERPRGSSARSA
jgi:hypothetical protein